MTIYYGTVNNDSLSGSAAADVFYLKAGNDTANGLGGDDTIYGDAGNDTLNGGNGHDALYGGPGSDRLVGGLGNDTYFLDSVTDVVVEAAGAGYDKIYAMMSYTLGANIESLVLNGASALNGTGNALNNNLYGTAADNVLDGRAGSDTMYGGAGNDTYLVDLATDVIYENTGAGTDMVKAAGSYTLTTNLENLMLLGAASLNGTGNALDNVIIGNAGNNGLDGGAGIDTVSYAMAATGVVVTLATTSSQATGAGTDRLLGFENLRGSAFDDKLTGSSGANALHGGNGSDVLTAGAGNDTLVGGDGNDWLDGGIGTDSLQGGNGADTYVVDSTADSIVETAGAGVDTVRSAVTWTLTNVNLENLVLTGGAAINGNGNGVANSLIGNGAANILSGAGGNDTLNGGLGNDYLAGGAGSDLFAFDSALTGANVDRIGDFSRVDDQIRLENAVFWNLSPGTLLFSQFLADPYAVAAFDAYDRIIYNTTTGALYYDADGAGGNQAVQFATLVGAPAGLTNADFVVT